MGADFSAEAVIGLRVAKEELFKPRRVKAFHHDQHYDPDVVFDTRTGKKLWSTELYPIEGYDVSQGTLHGYKVAAGTDGRQYYIAIRLASDTYSNAGNNDCMVPLNHLYLNDDVAKFREVMSKAGLWDEDNFGLWAVLYCSY